MIGQIIKEKYKIEKILGKGAMGEVYLCRNLEIGNLWAIKFIRTKGKSVHLMAEVDILKKLDHFSLPHIADIFEDDEGIYLVESYVEGKELYKKLKDEGPFEEEVVVEWAKNLADGLGFLHNIKPHPIIYRDMKPHNVIITSDNRAIIVDFGISKEFKWGEKDQFIAYTPDYAAPEQLDPNGVTDERTDIYSLGVTIYQLLTGKLPQNDAEAIYKTDNTITDDLICIVEKCISKNPAQRYFSVEELRSDLEKLKEIKIAKLKLKFKNRIIISLSIAMSIISFSATYLGLNRLYMEKAAIVDIDPKIILLSAQQEGELSIQRKFPDGSNENILHSNVLWSTSDTGVAVVKNGKVLALNEGEADITGKYDDKVIKLHVKVNPPELNALNVSLKYNDGAFVEKLYGTGDRDIIDGDINKSSFQEPMGIAHTPKGLTYVIDTMRLREIQNGKIRTVELGLDISNVKADKNNNVYYSVDPYISTDEKYKVGIYRLQKGKGTEIYANEDGFATIADFAIDSQGNIFALINEEMEGKSKIVYIEVESRRSTILLNSKEKVSGITIDSNDNLYMTSKDSGQIYKWEKGETELEFLAGKWRDFNFRDGLNNRFFEINRILAHGNYLYIIDKNLVRRVLVEDGKLVDVETLAGQVGKGMVDFKKKQGIDAYFDQPMDFCIEKDGNLLVADKNNHIIQKLFVNNNK